MHGGMKIDTMDSQTPGLPRHLFDSGQHIFCLLPLWFWNTWTRGALSCHRSGDLQVKAAMSFLVLTVAARVVHLPCKLVDLACPRYLYRPPSLRLSIGLQLWPFQDDWECGRVGAYPALGVTVRPHKVVT